MAEDQRWGGAKRNPGVGTEHGHGSSRCCLARRQVSRQALSADGVRCREQGGFPARVTCPELPTCPDACLPEEPGQALHAVEGVEVVYVLVQPVHPILVLQAGRDNAVGRRLPAWPPNKSSCATSVCAWEAGPRGQGREWVSEWGDHQVLRPCRKHAGSCHPRVPTADWWPPPRRTRMPLPGASRSGCWPGWESSC